MSNEKVIKFLCEFRKDRDTNIDKGLDLSMMNVNGLTLLALLAEIDCYDPCELMVHNEQDERGIKIGFDMCLKILTGAILDNLDEELLCN